MKVLSREEARHVYNRLGKRLDSQSFYENRALELIIKHGQFSRAQHVFEFGCGTGRFALKLFSEHVPGAAVYHGVDLSPTMVGLARDRLAEFGSRAKVSLSDGSPPVQELSEYYSHFVSTFVLDLLSKEDIALILRESHRMLKPGGLLCLSSLSAGSGTASRLVARLWTAAHVLSPALVGGCRPIELAGVLAPSEWRLRFHTHVSPFAIPLEVVVAERL
ncbi:MAG: class I SAM-dependent methyltransferase [Bacteroidetes bacterium]|nr:class I SAM-dependent methyltransferase [Bacteroidota bacterium]